MHPHERSGHMGAGHRLAAARMRKFEQEPTGPVLDDAR